MSNRPNALLGNWIRNDIEKSVAECYSEKPIGQYNTKDMEALVDMVARWRVLLGVTNESTPVELRVITQFIYDSYKSLTLKDIELAMMWSINGTIEIGFVTQKNISAYYVSRCINAFIARKREIVNEIAEKKERYLAEQAAKESQITPQQKAEKWKSYFCEIYNKYAQTGQFFDFHHMIYNWLRKVNMLNVPKEEIAASYDYATNRITKEREERKLKPQKSYFRLEGLDDEDKLIKRLRREYVIMKLFDRTDLGTFIRAIKIDDFK